MVNCILMIRLFFEYGNDIFFDDGNFIKKFFDFLFFFKQK